LIARGADVNAKTDRGITALILATQGNETALAAKLKQAGARE
jgi:ankyrin repeat protein